MIKGKRRRNKRDFWQSWQESYAQAEEPRPKGRRRRPGRSQQRARHWREHFHRFMGAWPEEHWAFSGRRFNPWRQGDHAFNPLVASLLSKGGGLLALYVLHLLSERPRYGNEIMDAISDRTGGGWATNPGAIYPLINILEEQGLVRGEWDDPRKRTVRHYELTASGRLELERLRAIVKPKLHEAIAVLENIAEDLNGGEFI